MQAFTAIFFREMQIKGLERLNLAFLSFSQRKYINLAKYWPQGKKAASCLYAPAHNV